MKLTLLEIDSPCWQKVSADIEEQLRVLCSRLEKPQLDADTCELRGRIAALRKVLNIAKPEEKPLGRAESNTSQIWGT